MNTNATTSQIIEALPPQWQGQAILGLGIVQVVILGCHFAASHGGVRGICLAVWRGKS